MADLEQEILLAALIQYEETGQDTIYRENMSDPALMAKVKERKETNTCSDCCPEDLLEIWNADSGARALGSGMTFMVLSICALVSHVLCL